MGSTSPLTQGRGLKLVSPLVRQCLRLKSPLTQGRGLKLGNPPGNNIRDVVAPYAGAWIETGKYFVEQATHALSPLTQGRGLKRRVADLAPDYEHQVAPYAGAWIETDAHADRAWLREVAPYAGAWIETPNIPS